MHTQQGTLLYICTVFCEITELRKNGLRLRPDEWPLPEAGQLRMDYWTGDKNNYRRTLRQAGLWRPVGVNWRLALTLADPDWIDVVGDALLMRGVVLQIDSGRIYEHEQLWLVRGRIDLTGPVLPRFDPTPWISRLPQA